MPDSTNEKYSVPAFQEKRLKERARVAQLVLVALVAGFVGAGWGYLKGEVAVLSGQSEMASVLLAQDQLAASTSPAIMQNAVPSMTASNASAQSADFSNPQMQNGGTQTTGAQKNSCVVGGEDKCRNRCSASYVKISGSNIATYDCYGKEGDPGKKAIDALAQCVAKVLGGSAPPALNKSASPDFLKQNLCMVDAPKVAQVDNAYLQSGQEMGEVVDAAAKGEVVIPQSCKAEYEAVKKLYTSGKEGNQSNINCSVGASVCTQKDSAASAVFQNQPNAQTNSGSYVCVPKPKAGQGGAENPSQDQSTWDCIKKAGANLNELWKCRPGGSGGGGGSGPSGGGGSGGAQNGVTGSGAGGGMPKPPTGGGSGGGSSGGGGQQQPQCPAGYVLSNQAPQTQSSSSVNTSGTYPVVYNNSSTTLVCVPANQANAQPPQCVFNASKNNPTKGEKITLTWSTTNTDNGGRTTLSDGTNTGRIENTGTQEVTINSARTYTLTAYNAKNETKVCTVAITLGGTGEAGTAGAYPPKLSCAPSIIEKDKSATITWECPTAAKKSAGEGTTTGGDVAGRKTVTPENNTEYTISCYKTETADLDDEESEDFLGKRTCSVRVAEPEFDIIAYPEKAKRGERVRISWGSLFMKTCQVTGPRGFDYTRPNGVVVTEPFSTNEATAPDRTIRAAVYTITCESIFGKRYSADVEVDFEN